MPIILVSVDSKNDCLTILRDMKVHIDCMLVSEDVQANSIADTISNTIPVSKRIDTDLLSRPKEDETDEDISLRMQASIDFIRSLDIVYAMVVSHHSVLKKWRHELEIDEIWDIIEM